MKKQPLKLTRQTIATLTIRELENVRGGDFGGGYLNTRVNCNGNTETNACNTSGKW